MMNNVERPVTMSSFPFHGAITRRRILTLGAASAVAAIGAGAIVDGLGDRAPEPAFAQRPKGSAGYTPTYARTVFSGDPRNTGTQRWQWQAIQGNLPRPANVRDQLVYATAVRRDRDPDGTTGCVPPDTIQDSWLLRDATGRLVSRPSSGGSGPPQDVALDVGNDELRRTAASFLVEKCRRDRWSGVILDEVNAEIGWGFPGAAPYWYPTNDDWREAQLGFVSFLARELHNAGFALVGNISEPLYRPWCEDLTTAGMVTSSEFFVAGDARSNERASLENGQWTERLSWLDWSLLHASRVIVHDRQSDPDRISYGLSTFLLADNGNGVYGADEQYSADTPYTREMRSATMLGEPAGDRRMVGRSSWVREFANGRVIVNPSTTADQFGDAQIAPTSGEVVLY